MILTGTLQLQTLLISNSLFTAGTTLGKRVCSSHRESHHESKRSHILSSSDGLSGEFDTKHPKMASHYTPLMEHTATMPHKCYDNLSTSKGLGTRSISPLPPAFSSSSSQLSSFSSFQHPGLDQPDIYSRKSLINGMRNQVPWILQKYYFCGGFREGSKLPP